VLVCVSLCFYLRAGSSIDRSTRHTSSLRSVQLTQVNLYARAPQRLSRMEESEGKQLNGVEGFEGNRSSGVEGSPGTRPCGVEGSSGKRRNSRAVKFLSFLGWNSSFFVG